jgi:hypothetical protein
MHFKSGRNAVIGVCTPKGTTLEVMVQNKIQVRHNSVVSNPSGMKLFNLLHTNEFEISAPQCPTRYSSMGNGDVLNVVVHKNVQLSEVITGLRSFTSSFPFAGSY